MTNLLHFPTLLRMARDTVADPVEGARTILALRPSRDVLWTALVLLIVLGLIVNALIDLVIGAPKVGIVPDLILPGTVEFGMTALAALLVDRVGRSVGGSGDFDGALVLLIWLSFILLLVQGVQLLAIVILPNALVYLIGLASVGLFFWLLTYFVATLHGFPSLWKTFFSVLAGLFCMGLVLSALLRIFGINPAIFLGL